MVIHAWCCDFSKVVETFHLKIRYMFGHKCNASSVFLARQDVLGHGDGSTASGFVGSHGQGSSDDSRKRGVDLTISQSLEMNITECRRTTVPMWAIPHCDYELDQEIVWKINIPVNDWACHNSLPVSVSDRLEFESRAKCQDCGKKKMIVSTMKLSPCCNNNSYCGPPNQVTWRPGDRKQFAPLWRVWAEQLKMLFPEGDDTSVLALDARSQVLQGSKKWWTTSLRLRPPPWLLLRAPRKNRVVSSHTCCCLSRPHSLRDTFSDRESRIAWIYLPLLVYFLATVHARGNRRSNKVTILRNQ